MTVLKNFFKVLFAYLTIAGIVTFSLFICEEAFQTAMFGTWPAQDARDWVTVKRGIRVMVAANNTMKLINYSVGYIQPLAFFAYRAYGRSADYYVDALTSKVMANAPELFKGDKITLVVKNKSYDIKNGNREYHAGKITIILTENQTFLENNSVTGILEEVNGRLILKVSQKQENKNGKQTNQKKN